MIPGTFDYHRPSTVSEAVAMLGELGEDARVVAGGHSLIPMMKLRMAAPEHLIDLQDVAELNFIEEKGGEIAIGAMVTQSALIASDVIASSAPILCDAALQIADPQVRNLGTVGGNVANGDPGNDLPALMQCLDAVYDIAGAGGTRQVSARDFYEAAYFTALEEGEIVTGVRFAAPKPGHGHAYEKQKRKVGDYATAAAAVIIEVDGGKCSHASVALTNVGDTPLYAENASTALLKSSLDDAAIEEAVAAARAITKPAADGRGPADFRTHVAGVMVRRAIELARDRAS
ncbi:MAG: FAD binding domain-containing protein [Hyphomicrobiales bacterium]